MSEYIVTGGTGFIGRNLIRYLIQANNVVYAIVRPESNNLYMLPKHNNVIPVFSSIKDLHKHIKELPSSCKAVYHFAWQGVNREEINDDQIQQKNVDDSLELLNICLDIGSCAFMFAGSRSEYGIQKDFYSENLHCQPQVAYGRAKLDFGNKAYSICRKSGMKFIHPRIFSVYGPDDHPWSLISTSIRKMLAGEDMNLSECKHFWNFMYIDDAVDLITTICEENKRIPSDDNCIINVATRDIRPLREYVEEIRTITCSSSKLNYGAFAQSPESAVSLLPDMTKVESIFNWTPRVSFSNGIKNIIRVMEEQNA